MTSDAHFMQMSPDVIETIFIGKNMPDESYHGADPTGSSMDFMILLFIWSIDTN